MVADCVQPQLEQRPPRKRAADLSRIFAAAAIVQHNKLRFQGTFSSFHTGLPFVEAQPSQPGRQLVWPLVPSRWNVRIAQGSELDSDIGVRWALGTRFGGLDGSLPEWLQLALDQPACAPGSVPIPICSLSAVAEVRLRSFALRIGCQFCVMVQGLVPLHWRYHV